MKRAILPLLLAAAAQFGCAPDSAKTENIRSSMRDRERVSYYDRNADGKVDREFHRFVGWADSDWELLDDDFDGRFEKKIRYGVSVLNSIVDISVPKGVPIEIVSEDKKK
jgi:hypothetical protein